jgi:hypothetical protein
VLDELLSLENGRDRSRGFAVPVVIAVFLKLVRDGGAIAFARRDIDYIGPRS